MLDSSSSDKGYRIQARKVFDPWINKFLKKYVKYRQNNRCFEIFRSFSLVALNFEVFILCSEKT